MHIVVGSSTVVVKSNTAIGSIIANLYSADMHNNILTGTTFTLRSNPGSCFKISGNYLTLVRPLTANTTYLVVIHAIQGASVANLTLIVVCVASVLQPVITINPTAPNISDTTPLGAVIANVSVMMSDGTPFIGLLQFAAPNFDCSGVFALLDNNQIIVNPNGPGIVNTMDVIVDNITLEAVST